jgi:CheY-like chemotaxis protein
VLVVDDEPAVRQVARRLLERGGYRAITVEDGQAAVNALHLHRHEVAAVLLDMNMPGMSGPVTFAALRAINTALPVVFCSGQSADGLVVELAMPGTAFIAKPYSQDELTGAIARLVHTAPARRSIPPVHRFRGGAPRDANA